MKAKKKISFFLFFTALLWGSIDQVNNAWSANEVDHCLYAGLLKKYVKNEVVNYQGFKSEEAKLDQYLEVLENADTGVLPRNEQFAFYINAYNAWTIKLILSDYPGVKSIKDLAFHP